MKGFFRRIFVNFFSLLMIAKVFGAISYSDDFLTLFFAAVCLTVFNLSIKPLLNLFLMPINLLTLGAFRWITNVIIIFLVTIFIKGFRVLPFVFPGFSSGGFSLPAIHFSLFWSLILVSFLVEVSNYILSWFLS
ncbi:MAG: phage holin family protein [Microgenomates group bacterium]